MASAPPLPNLYVLASADVAASEYDISDPAVLKIIVDSQRRHFWWQVRNRRILAFLRADGICPPARLLEIGCGTGVVLCALARSGCR